MGILGYMGTYFFLLSSYYGAINRLADGGEARYRGYRLAAASGPILVLVLLVHSVRILGAGPALSMPPPMPAHCPDPVFFHQAPDIAGCGFGNHPGDAPLQCLRHRILHGAGPLQAPACTGLDIRAAGSVLSSVLLMTLLPMAEMGVRKWFI